MIADPRIAAVVAGWSDLSLQPIRVTLRLASPLGGSEALHLDGLLAQALVAQATQGHGLEPTTEPYDQPLPLACLWREPERGLPLWACTAFAPVGLAYQDVSTWTRQDMHPAIVQRTKRGDAYAPRRTEGAEKAQGVPLPTTIAEAWTADAIGDPQIVASLLTQISHVGKKRSQGFGVVADWEVQPISTFALTDDAGSLRRPVPVAAVQAWGVPLPMPFSAGMLGWTPPYWHLGSMAMCLPAGSVLTLPSGAWS